MEALPFASWFKDSEGNFNQANEELLLYLKKSLSEVIGKNSQDVFDEQDTRQSDQGDRDVYDTGKVVEATHSRNKRIFKTVNFPVFDEIGKIA